MTTMNTNNKSVQKKLTFKITDAEKQLDRAKSIFIAKSDEQQVINKVYHNPKSTVLQKDLENMLDQQQIVELQKNKDQLSSNSLSPIAKDNFNSGQQDLVFSNEISPQQSIQQFNSQRNTKEYNQNYISKNKLLQSNTNRTQARLDTQLLSNNLIEIMDPEDQTSKSNLQTEKKLLGNISSISNKGPIKSLLSKFRQTNGDFESTLIQNYEQNSDLNQLNQNRRQFYIENGNNSNMLEILLLKRGNWDQNLDLKAQGISFKWLQSIKGIQFDQLNTNDKNYQLQLVNHFQFQKALGDKIQLYANLEQYCKENSMQLNQIMPQQFSINISSPDFGSVINDIMKQFKKQQWKLPTEKNIEKTFQTKLTSGKRTNISKVPIETQWMLKISNLNNLKGVQLIENYEEFTDIMQYKIGKEEQIQEFRVDSNGEVDKRNYSCYLRSDEFVLQQYLTNPLLIDEKKVQIGALILITNGNVYFCKESNVRVADRNYVSSIDGIIGNISNPYPMAYLKEKVKDKLDFDLMIQKIKEKCKITYLAVREKINKEKMQFCMEIFEFEFFIDAFGECFLIEVNTNLNWMTTSNYLRTMSPSIINEALKLTLDPLFPPAVEVASDYENIWCLIN